MLVFIPPPKKISKTAVLEERRGGAKVKLRATMVWFSLFSVAIQGIFSIVCVRDHCVFVIVNVNKTQLTAL